MDINLSNIGKRYRFEWIFRGINLDIQSGQQWAVLGPNGSGKSTLLKILSGHLSPSKGSITFSQKDFTIEQGAIYRQIALAAPYVELIEEFTLKEILDFQSRFKPFLKNLTAKELINILDFASSTNKPVKFFSSGMKQRLKLVLALCSDAPLLLLDEPTTNLDEQGVAWYRDLIDEFAKNRTLIIASNIKHDYDFCGQTMNILEYKKVNRTV